MIFGHSEALRCFFLASLLRFFNMSWTAPRSQWIGSLEISEACDRKTIFLRAIGIYQKTLGSDG